MRKIQATKQNYFPDIYGYMAPQVFTSKNSKTKARLNKGWSRLFEGGNFQKNSSQKWYHIPDVYGYKASQVFSSKNSKAKAQLNEGLSRLFKEENFEENLYQKI